MSTIFSIYNAKGGVGKTTGTLNIGGALAELGYKVLLIDTDKQSNLSLCFGVDPYVEKSIGALLMGKFSIQEVIIKYEKMHLIPSAKYMHSVVKSLNGETARERLLRKAIKPIKDQYDYILIDCAPSSNLLTENALVASDYVLTPLEAAYFASDGINSILDDIEEIKEDLNEELTLGGIFLNEYHENLRSNLVQGFAQAARGGGLGDYVFNTYIRKDSSLERSPMLKQTVFQYKPESNGATDYMKLTKEIISKYERR